MHSNTIQPQMRIEVLRVDGIELLRSSLDLDIRVSVMWLDGRVTFRHLHPDLPLRKIDPMVGLLTHVLNFSLSFYFLENGRKIMIK